MKILYIISYYKPAYVYGGPVKSISLMCEALAGLDEEVSVWTTNANGRERLDVPLAQPVEVDGVAVSYYPLVAIPPRGFFYSPELARACREKIHSFDLVVHETLYTHALGAGVAACRRSRVPYIIPLRGQLLPWSLRQRPWKKRIYLALLGRRALRHASALHATDPFEARKANALGLRAPIFVVPNGIDLSRFTSLPDRGHWRARLGIDPQALVVLFAGRLHRKKRPDLAVEALAAAQGGPRQVHLLMAGPDEEHLVSSLYSQAQRLGCAPRLHFLGLLGREEILTALADADLLVMPSEPDSENFGMSTVEALAAGVPVLVSEGVPVGVPAAAAGAGRMVPCVSAAFAQAARELLANPETLPAMGEKGRSLVKQRFDLPVVARQMLAQFRAIVATGKPLNNGVT
jgi:glycosyltransferase involved in cell wall biosynthesis